MAKRIADESDRLIGARITERRAMLGISQSELGESLGVSFQQIQKYERGTNRLGLKAAVLICRKLGMTVEQLTQGIGAGDQKLIEPLHPKAMKIAARCAKIFETDENGIAFDALDAVIKGFERVQRNGVA